MATSIEDIVMNDGVSGPAGAAQSAVERLAVGLGIAGASSDALGKVMSASSSALTDMAQRAKASGMTELAAAANAAAAATEKAEKAAKGEADALAKEAAEAKKTAQAEQDKMAAARTQGNDQLAGAFGIPTDEIQGLKMAIDAEIAVVKALAGLAAAGAKMSIDSVTFRENTEMAFQAITGSETKSSEIYEKALDLADKIGLSKEQVVADLKKLMSAGLGEDVAFKVVKAVGDVTQVLGEGAGSALKDVISLIEAKGAVDNKSLNKLAKQGINLEEIYANLAKTTGKSVKEVEAGLKAGTIDTAKAIEAVTKTAEDKFGGIAEKAGQSVPRLIGDIQNEFARLFDKIDLSGLKDFLHGISDALTGEAGEKLRGSLEHLFNAIFGLFDKLGGGKGPAGIVEGIASAIDGMASFVSTVGPPVIAVLGVIIDSVEILAKHWGALAVVTAPVWLLMLPIIAAVAAVIGAVVLVVWALGEAFDAVSNAISSAWGAIAGFFSGLDLGSIGTDMIAGLVNGIASGGGAVVDALVGAVMSAVNAAEAALGISSPSTVLAGIGGHTAKGFELGIMSGTDGIAGAARAMADAAIPANDVSPGAASSGSASPGGSPGGSSGGNAGNVFHIAFSPAISIPGSSSPEEAKKLAAAATQGAQETFERNAADMLRRVAARG